MVKLHPQHLVRRQLIKEVTMGLEDVTFDTGIESNGDTDSVEISPQDASEIYHGFLNNIPEQDRQIVGRYAKDWDGAVTKQFQKIHEQYKPYKELGDVEALQQAQQFVSKFNEMPLEVYQVFKQGLIEHFGEDFEDQLMNGNQEYEESEYEEYEDDDDDGGDYEEIELPDAVLDFLEQIGATVDDIQSWREQQEAAAEEQYENEQLDNLLKDVHNSLLKGYKLDSDDDDWLLIQMSKGKEPKEAAEAWIKKFGGQQSGARPVAPRIMSGQGGVPNDQVDLTKLRGQDRRNAVAAILEQARGA
jgi:hypothetical protein